MQQLASPILPDAHSVFGTTRGITRVIVVVLDGLRPDAIDSYDLHHIRYLMQRGASTRAGTTVAPSVTAAAMASLLTGVHPAVHGLRSDRFHIPEGSEALLPLPRVLAKAGIPTFAFMRDIPLLLRPLGMHIARRLGIRRATFRGTSAPMVLVEARETLCRETRGLFVLHWADADIEYRVAARKLDATLGLLAALLNVSSDPSTLLIALADHGGGGTVANNHDSDHPLDRTIPVLLSGGAVTPGLLYRPVHLLDIPATVLHAFGVDAPAQYAGRALTEVFVTPVAVVDGMPEYAIAS
jgi:arylsulfatase A-like enzyme